MLNERCKLIIKSTFLPWEIGSINIYIFNLTHADVKSFYPILLFLLIVSLKCGHTQVVSYAVYFSGMDNNNLACSHMQLKLRLRSKGTYSFLGMIHTDYLVAPWIGLYVSARRG